MMTTLFVLEIKIVIGGVGWMALIIISLLEWCTLTRRVLASPPKTSHFQNTKRPLILSLIDLNLNPICRPFLKQPA
jgi:hypothetical protein